MALYMILVLLVALANPVGDLPSGFPAGDDDDEKRPVLSIDDVTIDESGSEAAFTVTRTGKGSALVEVKTLDIEATDGTDYIHQSTILIFPKSPKVATQTVTVPIINDDRYEDTETFAVILSNPLGARLEKGTGIGTIVDDDPVGVVIDSGDGVFVVEGEAGDTISLALQSQPADDVTITIVTDSDQLITEPEHLSFDADNWAQPQQVGFAAIADGIDEDDPHQVPIAFSVESTDAQYASLTLPPLVAALGDADALLVTIDGPSTGAIGMTSSFGAVVNAGGSGTITYGWTAFLQGSEVASGSEPTFEFAPQEPGAYIVRASVGDEHGQNPAEFIEFNALADITDSTFAMDILWLAEEDITRGCNPEGTEFCPDESVTRAQMAAFLTRFLNLTDDGGGNTFMDDDSSIFETDIAMIAAAGITQGCNPPDNDRFCPNDDVSRGQMAAFLVRALQLSGDGGGSAFIDDDSSIFEADIAVLAESGITRGCDATGSYFCPDKSVTRGQMAAFLHRAADLLP